MADKIGEGGVVYRKAEAGYFEKRGFRRYAGVWSLWALGVGAVISGHYSGWNLGLRHGRLGRHAGGRHHHHDHVSRPRLLHRRDGAGAAAYRRGLFLRPLGDGAVGRLHHRPLRERRICAHAGGDRLLHRLLYGSASSGRRPNSSRCGGSLMYAVFLALNIVGVELSFKVTLVVTLAALAVLIIFWVSAFPHHRFQPLGAEHRARRHRAARRQRPVLPVRHPRRPRHAALRGVAVPRHRATAARGGGIDRSQARHAEGHHPRHVHADRSRPA